MANMDHLLAAMKNAVPTIQEYRDDIVHRDAEHKLTKTDTLNLLRAVRHLLHTNGKIIIGSIAEVKQQLKDTQQFKYKMINTEWLEYCLTLLRTSKVTIGTDDSIFKSGRMDITRFVAAIESFSIECRAVLEEISYEIAKGHNSSDDPAVDSIHYKIEDLAQKIYEFLRLSFFA